MALHDYEPRIARNALHRKEEQVKQVFRDQVAEAAGLLEVALSAIVLVALLLSIVPLLELMPGLLTHGDSVEVREFLERALDIVIGIEFIKMLAKHSPGSVLEVLLYAIARHMIVGHEDAVQNPPAGAAAETSCCRAWVLYGTIKIQILGNEEHPHGFT